MDLNLNAKTALVCGSTQGIGWSSALELAKLGANIVLMARDHQKLKSLSKELPKNENQQHHLIVADFNDPNSVKEGLEAATNLIIKICGGEASKFSITGKLVYLYYLSLYLCM